MLYIYSCSYNANSQPASYNQNSYSQPASYGQQQPGYQGQQAGYSQQQAYQQQTPQQQAPPAYPPQGAGSYGQPAASQYNQQGGPPSYGQSGHYSKHYCETLVNSKYLTRNQVTIHLETLLDFFCTNVTALLFCFLKITTDRIARVGDLVTQVLSLEGTQVEKAGVLAGMALTEVE